MLKWPIIMKGETNCRFKGRKSHLNMWDHIAKADRAGSQGQEILITGGKILRNQLWKVQQEKTQNILLCDISGELALPYYNSIKRNKYFPYSPLYTKIFCYEA